MPTTRKNPKKPLLNSLNTSSDYHPIAQILSPNASNFAALSTKGMNNVSSSAVRSLVNQTDISKISFEEGLNVKQM